MTPSRGRPKQLARMAASIRRTAARPVEIIIWLDDDDPSMADNLQVCNTYGMKWIVGPRNVVHSSRWDRCLPKANGDILFHANDDIVLGTPGWDVMVAKEFEKCPDRILMVHGDDIFCQRDQFAAHPIIHRRWLDTVGYFIPDCFDGEYGDTVVNFIANEIGRRKYLPFICEHKHYSRMEKETCPKCGSNSTVTVEEGTFCNSCGHLFEGKNRMDQTTMDYLARQREQNPQKIFEERRADWLAAAAKLRAVMGTPWLRDSSLS